MENIAGLLRTKAVNIMKSGRQSHIMRHRSRSSGATALYCSSTSSQLILNYTEGKRFEEYVFLRMEMTKGIQSCESDKDFSMMHGAFFQRGGEEKSYARNDVKIALITPTGSSACGIIVRFPHSGDTPVQSRGFGGTSRRSLQSPTGFRYWHGKS